MHSDLSLCGTADLDLLGQPAERGQVGGLSSLQYGHHLQHLRLGQLPSQPREVAASSTPELNLLKRTRAHGRVQRPLTAEQLLNLSGPVDQHHWEWEKEEEEEEEEEEGVRNNKTEIKGNLRNISVYHHNTIFSTHTCTYTRMQKHTSTNYTHAYLLVSELALCFYVRWYRSWWLPRLAHRARCGQQLSVEHPSNDLETCAVD